MSPRVAHDAIRIRRCTPAPTVEDNMRKIALGLIAAVLLAAPAFAEEHEMDIEKAMEHMELEHARAEFGFEQEMREVEIEERHLELDMMRRQLDHPKKHPKKDHAGGICLVLIIVHILMAIWVYQDVRRKNNGNGIWIIITLLAGFFGASVYALVRIGDTKPAAEE